MIALFLTPLAIDTTCGSLKTSYSNASCCDEGVGDDMAANCPSGCTKEITGMVPVTAAQVGTHSYIDVLGSTWDAATTNETLRSTMRLRINTPVRSHDGDGAELPVFLGYKRGGSTWPMAAAMNIEDALPLALRPERITKTLWDKNKVFPLLIQLPGGNQGLDAFPSEVGMASADIAIRHPLQDDFVVVHVMPESSNDMSGGAFPVTSAEVKRIVEWAIATLPQIDTSKVSLWGHSGGANVVLDYAAAYDTTTAVTHGVALAPSLSAATAAPVIASNFTLPVYTLTTVGDENAVQTTRTRVPSIQNTCPGMRLTVLDGFTSPPAALTDCRQAANYALAVGAYAAMGANMPNHLAMNFAGGVFDEVSSGFTLKTTPFPPAKDGRMTAFEIAAAGSGYVAGDVITVYSPYASIGGQSMTFTIGAENLDANGAVTSTPAITSAGTMFSAAVGQSTVGPFAGLISGGSGSGIAIKILAADAFLFPSPWDPATNKPYIDPYGWVLA